jgi:hypothetical protein
MLILPPAPPSKRGGVIFLIENSQWLVTLGGYARDYPPTDDEAGFMAFAKDLRSPLLYQAIQNAEPLSEIRGWRQTVNLWRRFERSAGGRRGLSRSGMRCGPSTRSRAGHDRGGHHRGRPRPSSSRPRHRHGDGLAGFARPFQRLVAGHGADAWQLSTGENLRYETAEGPGPGRLGRLADRYADRVLAVANGNQDVQAASCR